MITFSYHLTVNPIETLLEGTHAVRRQEEKYRGGEGRGWDGQYVVRSNAIEIGHIVVGHKIG